MVSQPPAAIPCGLLVPGAEILTHPSASLPAGDSSHPVMEQEAGLWRVRSCCHGREEFMQWDSLGKVLPREQGLTGHQAPALAEMWHGDS